MVNSQKDSIKPKLSLLMPKPDPISLISNLMNPPECISPVSWVSPSLSPEAFFNYGNTQALSPTFNCYQRPSSMGFYPSNERRNSSFATPDTLGISLQKPGTKNFFSQSAFPSLSPLTLDFGVINQPMIMNQTLNPSQQTHIIIPIYPPWIQGNQITNAQFLPELNLHNLNIRLSKPFSNNLKPSNPPRRLPPFQKPLDNPGPLTEEDINKQKSRLDIHNKLKQRLKEKIRNDNAIKMEKATITKKYNTSPNGKSKRLETSTSQSLEFEDTISKRQKLESENSKSELKTNDSEEFGNLEQMIDVVNLKTINIDRISQNLSDSAVIPCTISTNFTQVSPVEYPCGMLQSPLILSNQFQNPAAIFPDNQFSRNPHVEPVALSIISTQIETPVCNETIPTHVFKNIPKVLNSGITNHKPESAMNNHIWALPPSLTEPIFLSTPETSTSFDSIISALSVGSDSSPTTINYQEYFQDTSSSMSMHLVFPHS
ncbi:hypothetical protein HK096_000475 [Nowakowskiella sp. JEL0078]|nr:hypothetical protein HK096_000475 [Nowakowskiella sp. JEL0078]